MTEREQIAEALLQDLGTLALKHGLTVFIENTHDCGQVFHLLQQQAALARILDDWQTPARMN